jgi:DNA-binding transcriptional MerR regulator
MVRMVDEDGFNMGDEDVAGGSDAGRARLRKTAEAFRTISEVADELHVPQHVLRFWETKFPQVRPLKRGGGRRYYRPEDVALLRRVADLLYTQGYTIKGVQRLLREGGGVFQDNIPPAPAEERLAAEAERQADLSPTPPTISRKAPNLLPDMPDLLPAAEPSHPPFAAPPTPIAASPQDELEKLRYVLRETLQALEDLRKLLG